MNEQERAEMLAALAAVDYVTVFDELSPRKLIAELLPDVQQIEAAVRKHQPLAFLAQTPAHFTGLRPRQNLLARHRLPERLAQVSGQ